MGKCAILLVTAGGWEELFAACGIKGPIDDLLFPINHGIFYSPDYDVLSPCVVYSADRLDDAGLEPVARTRNLVGTCDIEGKAVVPSWRTVFSLLTPKRSFRVQKRIGSYECSLDIAFIGGHSCIRSGATRWAARGTTALGQ
jgi:hypothetical protein